MYCLPVLLNRKYIPFMVMDIRTLKAKWLNHNPFPFNIVIFMPLFIAPWA